MIKTSKTDLKPTILDSIQASYRGRIPSRADGKKRRRLILNAVRKIIIKKGAQGVKHRAIAEMAKVPLAATTYYFPDIQALLHDAFLDFFEANLLQLQQLEIQSRELLSLVKPTKISNADKKLKTEITDALTRLVIAHIEQQVANRDDRIVERAFRNESIRNPSLATMVNQMEIQQIKAISQFMEALGSNNADSDSREVMAIILFLEHSLLAGYVDKLEAKETVERLFSRLLGVS